MTHPADGRHAAFQAEALQHLDAVYRYAYALTRDQSEAEDLTQDTFLQALRHWEQFRPGTNARAWLFTICRNLFLRQRERRAREEPTEAAVLDGIASTAQAFAAPADAGRALFDAPELGDVIRKELDKLPAEYREVVELSDLQDQSYADIAQVLGVPLGTVKSRLFRGRRLLQEALVDYARDAGLLPPPGSDA
ncbi:MAG TPA: sigma-70 family RNA polymerase sigma factor [Gemmatimonadales bacterium]|nr:sigma-70 family RNA polymerase sigma factor [Gemmatimonadales bacterium]